MDYIDVQEVTDETKSLSGTNSPLQNAIQQEKEVQKLAIRFAATKTNGNNQTCALHERHS